VSILTNREMYLMNQAFKAGNNGTWASLEEYLFSTLVPVPGGQPVSRRQLLEMRAEDRDLHPETTTAIDNALAHLAAIDRTLSTMLARQGAGWIEDVRGGRSL